MHKGSLNQFRRPRGSFPSNLNMKHYKLAEILSNFQNVKSTCADIKPTIEGFLATVLVQNFTSFRVTVSLRLILRSLKK